MFLWVQWNLHSGIFIVPIKMNKTEFVKICSHGNYFFEAMIKIIFQKEENQASQTLIIKTIWKSALFCFIRAFLREGGEGAQMPRESIGITCHFLVSVIESTAGYMLLSSYRYESLFLKESIHPHFYIIILSHTVHAYQICMLSIKENRGGQEQKLCLCLDGTGKI